MGNWAYKWRLFHPNLITGDLRGQKMLQDLESNKSLSFGLGHLDEVPGDHQVDDFWVWVIFGSIKLNDRWCELTEKQRAKELEVSKIKSLTS